MCSRGRPPVWGVVLVLLVAARISPASAQPASSPRSPRNADYTVDVRLDTHTRLLRGHERIMWRNITRHAMRELQFHLYWNAWSDTKSTWMRETRDRRARRRPANEYTQVDITSLRLVSGAGADLMDTRRFISPDDGNTN